MEPTTNATVYIVDDDASVREALAWLLRSRRLFSESFESAEAFDAMLSSRPAQRQPCCLLLDVCLPGHADVPTAVDTVKRGAFDFCEKPFSDNALVDRVEQALAKSAERLAQLRERSDLQVRLRDLTDRERDVMDLVVAGLPNKLIADQLDISVRTVEVHRSRVFDKMQVKSAVELANLLRTEK